MDKRQRQIQPQYGIFIFKLRLSFILLVQEESNKQFNSFKFTNKQLSLMTKNTIDYSTEIMIFSKRLKKYDF